MPTQPLCCPECGYPVEIIAEFLNGQIAWKCVMCGQIGGQQADNDPCRNGMHQYRWITQPSTPNGPAEHFKVCQVCGMEEPGSDCG